MIEIKDSKDESGLITFSDMRRGQMGVVVSNCNHNGALVLKARHSEVVKLYDMDRWLNVESSPMKVRPLKDGTELVYRAP